MATSSTRPIPFFRDLTSDQKLAFVGKAFVFFITGGFVYPTMWVD
jgi:hypothetical protein